MTQRMTQPDLHRAADRLGAVIADIRADQLAAPTPCPDSPVATLLDHVAGFGPAFGACASKDLGDLTANPPVAAADHLDPQWRTSIPPALTGLADAWSDPAAWTGMTQVGGVDLPGEVAGVVALDELVIHGWDLARATGQPFEAADDDLLACLPFLEQAPDRSGALFGPVVRVAPDAPLLHRVLGLAGRDPQWQPS